MKTALIVLSSALGLGLLSDLLFNDAIFRSVPWGLSVLVLVMALSAVSLLLAWRTKLPSRRKNLLFLVPAIALAAGCAWRDSMVLRWLDVGAILFFVCAASVSLQGCQLALSGLSQYILTIFCLVESFFQKPVQLLFQDMAWNELLSDGAKSHVRNIARGLTFALPLLLLFGGLFVAADAAFEGLVRNSLQLDGKQFLSHTALLIGSFWVLAGFLHGLSAGTTESMRIDELKERITTFGAMEVGVILGSLNLLFLAFVIVQVRYFFGGANLIDVTHGLTYADYARRGFFELVTVASLMLPLLLFLDWVVEKKTLTSMIVVRGLTATLIGLLFVVMDSAVSRMMLYQKEYGLTELRLYTTAFMFWLAIVCVVFLTTVLRGNRQRFAICSFASGVVVILALHIANPDAMIVETNLAHAKNGKVFDAKYAISLSQDAIPAIVASLDKLPTADKELITKKLTASYEHAWSPDWRSWNWSRNQAYHAVSGYLRNQKAN